MMNIFRRLNRQGFSLTEVMLFTALAVLVGAVATDLYVRGSTISDETHKAVMVQQDVRTIVEYITRDMNGAYWVMNPSGDHATNLVLIKFASNTSQERLAQNLGGGNDHFDYPFARAGEPVMNSIDAYRVTYEFDADKQTVYRTEEKGIFKIATTASIGVYATDYAFETVTQDGLMDKYSLASNVKEFNVRYFGYEMAPTDARGALKEVWDLVFVENLSDDVKIAMTACILLKVNASYKEGMYKDGGKYRSPETTIMTKIWSQTKLKDEVYKQYFSSVDWNLQF